MCVLNRFVDVPSVSLIVELPSSSCRHRLKVVSTLCSSFNVKVDTDEFTFVVLSSSSSLSPFH